MKSCPSCNRTYEDTYTFCLVDGASLSVPNVPNYGPAAGYAPAPTVRVNFQAPPPGSPYDVNVAPTATSQAVTNGTTKYTVIALAVLGLLALGVIVGILLRNWNEEPSSGSGKTTTAGSSVTPSAQATPASTQATPPPNLPPEVSPQLNLMGGWRGSFANRSAVLDINNQQGNLFSGFLKNTKGAVVEISGNVDPATQNVSFREIRILTQASEGNPWVLGNNSGIVSSDGRQMRGSGSDPAGHRYVWSFYK